MVGDHRMRVEDTAGRGDFVDGQHGAYGKVMRAYRAEIHHRDFFARMTLHERKGRAGGILTADTRKIHMVGPTTNLLWNCCK